VSFTLVIDPRAEADLASVKADYDAEDPTIGRRFAAAVDDALDKIEKTPFLFPLVTDDVRFIIPRRFPYVVYYRVEGDHVVVLAVVHKRQDQAKWKRRL
jgi:toxin ParE1/3/4